MISIPLPFVIALMLAILLGLVIAQREVGQWRVIVFLGICLTLLIVVGLRWSVDLPLFRLLQPMLAALVPPAAWLCFAPLQGSARGVIWPHVLPVAAILLLLALSPRALPPIDTVLAGLFFGYGGLLLWCGLAGPDILAGARLSLAPQAGRAAMLAGALLVFFGLIDVAIALDFSLGDGGYAGRLVSAGGMVMLPLIAWATILIGRSTPEPAPEPIPEPAPISAAAETPPAAPQEYPAEDDHVLAEINRILTERRLYRDPDLTLERLSRRLAIPARQVSGAINRKLGLNVSQAINAWRIGEAMELLAETDRPVTTIMFDCGFQTKSNFNREFLRIAGTSPSEWRRRARAGAGAAAIAPSATAPETR